MIASWSYNDATYPYCVVRNEIRFEKERLWFLLKEFRLTNRATELWNDFDEYHGLRQLSFESFDRIFPTFPWQLATRCEWPTAWLDQVRDGLVFWFRNFRKTPVWTWYLHRRQLFADEFRGCSRELSQISEEYMNRPFGLIFRSRNTNGGYIVHNGKPQSTPHHRFTALDFDDRPGYFCIELYRSWLQGVAKQGWSPTLALADYRPARPRTIVGGAIVEPWMVRTLGTNSTVIMFGMLFRALYWQRYDKRWKKCFRRRRGEYCLLADDDTLAEMTGVSPRSSRAALTELRKRQLIKTKGKRIMLYLAGIQDAISQGEPPSWLT